MRLRTSSTTAAVSLLVASMVPVMTEAAPRPHRRLVDTTWYAARVWTPNGQAAQFKIRFHSRESDLATCASFLRQAGKTFAWAQSRDPGPRSYDAAHVETGLPGGQIAHEAGDRRDATDEWTTEECGGSRMLEPGIVDVAAAVVSRRPVENAILRVWIEPGAKLLAESWGSAGGALFSDLDFSGGRVNVQSSRRISPREATGGAVPSPVAATASARAIAGGSLTAGFSRTANAFFDVAPRETITGGALLSVTRPDGTTIGPTDRWIELAGGRPGSYTFRYDLLVRGGAITPYGILAVADIDFPACTSYSHLVRARDGHPLCT